MNPARILLALSLLVSVGGRLCAAGETPQALPRATPEEEGVSSAALLAFVDEAEQKVDALHSFMLVRHGHVVAEGWWSPYAAGEPHVLFSLSKSFTSTAVGLAVSEGKLSLSDPVTKFFPFEAPADPSANLKSMRVRDLLRMSTGQDKENIDKFPFHGDQDLVKAFMAMPVPFKPGTHFVYNTEATYMLSAIVQSVTGQTVLEYLRPRLFEPLGISGPTWESSAQGVSFGGFGLSVRTEDIARFGQLYLQKGKWNGRQLVPADWIDAATSLQTSNGSDPAGDWDQGYGYQFWRCRHGFYRGDGAFGQLCIVMPEYDAVLAVTAGTGDMPGELNVVWDKIIPVFSASALPADPASDRRLSDRLAGLRMAPQAGQASSPIASRIAGKRYEFPSNPIGIEAIVLEPAVAGSAQRITMRISGAEQSLECGNGSWIKGNLKTDPRETLAVAVSGAWTSDDTFTAVLCEYQTPFVLTERIRFVGDEVDMETHFNVGFSGNTPTHLAGKSKP